MKQLLFGLSLLSTIAAFAAPPTAEFVPFHAIIEGQEYAIINMITVGEKSFVHVRSKDGSDNKLIGKANAVYEMPDMSHMEGVDFDTVNGKEVKEIVGYKQYYDFIMGKPGTLIASIFIHAFAAYGIYHTLLKLSQKAKKIMQRNNPPQALASPKPLKRKPFLT